jgi:hypothetical protein
MKITIVPAQVTSVEDRIAGNLSFKQLLLMIAPVFLSTVLFIAVPPFASYTVLKLVFCVFIAIVFLGLALRIKSRLVIDWIVILSRYNHRPKFYVFNKNSTASRDIVQTKKTTKVQEQKAVETLPARQFAFNATDELSVDERLNNPAANLHFTFTKKGGLRVHIKEIK